MAISAIAVLEATPHCVEYLVTEDGNAVDIVAADVPGDAATGPLATLLAPQLANTAAAVALANANLDIMVYNRANVPAGATAGAALLVTFDISGAVLGNFEMNFTSAKAANGDTAVYVVRISLRHTLVD